MRKKNVNLVWGIIAAIIAFAILFFLDPSNYIGLALVLGIAIVAAIYLIASLVMNK